jgi:hypothetical protein
MYEGPPFNYFDFPGADFGAACAGYNDLSRNLQYAPKFSTDFFGYRFLTIGGAKSNGRWSVSDINSLISEVNANKIWSNGYHGVGMNIEIGDSGLAASFSQLFRGAKAKGLLVLVTVSGNAPYTVGDKCTLMSSIISDCQNINFVVPILYLFDNSAFIRTPNVYGWGAIWQNTIIPVVPALYKFVQMANVNPRAAKNKIKLSGYMLWINYLL